jgi:hypothetical protein
VCEFASGVQRCSERSPLEIKVSPLGLKMTPWGQSSPPWDLSLALRANSNWHLEKCKAKNRAVASVTWLLLLILLLLLKRWPGPSPREAGPAPCSVQLEGVDRANSFLSWLALPKSGGMDSSASSSDPKLTKRPDSSPLLTRRRSEIITIFYYVTIKVAK